MQVTVTGKQLDVGEALRTHVDASLDAAVGKYFDNSVDTAVVFSREAHLFRAAITVHVGRGITVRGRGEAAEPYAAFDAATDHVAKRLRRYKRRLRGHRKNEGGDVEIIEAQQYVLRSEVDGDEEAGDGHEHMIVAELISEIPTLTVGEAVMHLDLADSRQLMFRNSAHGGLNLVYRRDDGNIGWIDPRGNRTLKP